MNRCIVVVDDDGAILEILCESLRSEGFWNIRPFSSPREACGYLKSRKTDVLVTDFDMPGLNGTELIDAAPGISTVFMVSCSFPENEQLKRECAARGVIALDKLSALSAIPETLKKTVRANHAHSRLRSSPVIGNIADGGSDTELDL